MTVAENLQELIDAKADIKSAIESKGVEVTGGLTTYADAIREIEGGSGDVEGKFENGTRFTSSGTIKHIPLFDTSHWTTMNSMFEYCGNLLAIPLYDTSNVTNMERMFYDCNNLLSVPLLDTSNVTNMNSMFGRCWKISEIPLFNTGNVIGMGNTFTQCSNLETVPLFDTSSCTSMGWMFSECTKLKTIPQFDTSKVISFRYMFSLCKNLESVPELDATNCNTIEYMFYGCEQLTEIGGLNNFGMVQSQYGGSWAGDAFSGCKSLTRQSCVNIFNKLYDRKSAGYSVITLQFEPAVISRLTSEDIAIATNKGWIITS